MDTWCYDSTLLIRQTVLQCLCVCESLSVCYRDCLPGPISGCMYPAQNRWIDEYPVSHGPTPRHLTAVCTSTDGSIPKYRDSPGAGTYNQLYYSLVLYLVTLLRWFYVITSKYSFQNCNVLYNNIVFFRCGIISKIKAKSIELCCCCIHIMGFKGE